MSCLKAAFVARTLPGLNLLPVWMVCAMAVQACTGVIGAGKGQATGSGGSGVNAGNGTVAGTGGSGSASADVDAGAAAGGAVNADAGAGTTGTPPPVGTPTVARLSELQWANSVRDLLQLASTQIPTLATADAVVRLDNEADSLFVSQDLHDDLQAAAENLAAQIAGSTTALNVGFARPV